MILELEDLRTAGVTAATPAFEVIAYRGALVGSLGGWIADVKSRGGTVSQVPGGFFHGIKAGRFGISPPYVYELPPAWLLVVDGVDTATDQFLQLVNYQGVAEAADNQVQDVRAIGAAVGDLGNGIVKLLPLALYALAIGAAVYLVTRIARAVR